MPAHPAYSCKKKMQGKMKNGMKQNMEPVINANTVWRDNRQPIICEDANS